MQKVAIFQCVEWGKYFELEFLENLPPKNKEKEIELVKLHFHFSSLIPYTMSRHIGVCYSSSQAHTHGQRVDAELSNQSPHFTQVVL